jgi:hypothetical protein
MPANDDNIPSCLRRGKRAASKRGFKHNIRCQYVERGKPLKQAVAIAYSVARRDNPGIDERLIGKGMPSPSLREYAASLGLC